MRTTPTREALPDTIDNGFSWTPTPWGRALRSSLVARLARHFFTSLPLRLRGESGQEERDWRQVANGIGVPHSRLVRVQQVHGTQAIVIRRADVRAGNDSGRRAALQAAERPPDGGRLAEADIIVSNDPEAAVAVQVADCVPLLIADPASGAVAAVHAGWRGTAAGVALASVTALRREFESRPSTLVTALGPSIGPCCYVVGEEVRQAFERGPFGRASGRWFSLDAEGRLRLDLWAANRDQLLEAGVSAENVHLARLCTANHPQLFPSYRRDGPGTGRIAAVIRAGHVGSPRQESAS